MTLDGAEKVNLEGFGSCVSTHAEYLLSCNTLDEVFFQMQSMCFSDVFQRAMVSASADKALKRKVWEAFRENFSQCYEYAGILHHSLNKPYGYAGDFEILEHLYDHKIHKLTNPEYKCFDEYVQQLNLICAVRQRKDIIALLLRSFHRQGLRTFCSLGSGGAREIYDERGNLSGSDVLLVDLDERSFEFAKSRLSDSDIQISTAQLDAKSLTFKREFDVIYSFGLFDYLKDVMIDGILSTAKDAIAQGGYLVYSIKDTNHYHSWFYDILCDWRFVSRDTAAADAIAARNGLKLIQCIPTENGASRVYVCQVA